MERSDRFELIEMLVVLCLLIPAGAYFAAAWLFGHALLVGPFLFTSPLLAVLLTTLVVSYFRPSTERNRLVMDDELAREILEIARAVGSPISRVFPQINAQGRRKTLEVRKDTVDVYTDTWRALDPEARRFLAAHVIARESHGGPFRLFESVVLSLMLGTACFLASQNLWLIIPGQFVLVLSCLYLFEYLIEIKRVASADRTALSLTKNPAAARRVLAWHGRGDGILGSRVSAGRQAAFRESLMALGLS